MSKKNIEERVAQLEEEVKRLRGIMEEKPWVPNYPVVPIYPKNPYHPYDPFPGTPIPNDPFPNPYEPYTPHHPYRRLVPYYDMEWHSTCDTSGN